MDYFSTDEFLAIIETKVNNRLVNLISPAFITQGQYRSKVYCEDTHAVQLESIQDQDIQLTEKFSLPVVDNINQHFFQIIIFICNNLKSDFNNSIMQNHREETYSSLGIKNNGYTRTTHSFGDSSTHFLTRGIINNIDRKEIDWGLIYFFIQNTNTSEQGIHIEMIHPECCCTFFIPVKCTKGIFTTVRIKARDIKHIATHVNDVHKPKTSSLHYQRISSAELLMQDRTRNLSIMSSLLEFKFMIKRFVRRGRFILEP